MSGLFKVKHTTEGLMKLLMYGDYVKAKASAGNVTKQSVVERELRRYSYKTASTFKVAILQYADQDVKQETEGN